MNTPPQDANGRSPGADEPSAVSNAVTAQAAPLPSPDRYFLHLTWGAALIGAAYGLVLRLVFGGVLGTRGETASGAMLVSFLFLVPFLIGVLAVWLQPPDERSALSAFFRPWLPMLLFVVGSAVLLLEGSICIVMATPIFMVAGSLGGIITWAILRHVRIGSGTLGGLLLLPLLGGWVERDLSMPTTIRSSSHTIQVHATPAQLWQLINHATAIQPHEMQGGWAWRIGVPYPQQAITVDTANGRVRQLRWDKGVHFDEPILDWDENRYIRWSYDFANDSIPAAALDEHVTLGGRYFDLLDTSYRLTPNAAGTDMQIVVTYRVSTNFNFYAAWWAGLLVDDSAETILAFYRQRAEAAPPLAVVY